MKLLILTQTIDTEHPILGFFHRWVEEFAKHCEAVHVVCLQEGEHDLPENVHVHSLGKEARVGRIAYLLLFYRYAWKLRHEYDAVFVHMNQIYVILGWPLWKLLGKRIGLWYMHKSVSFSLRVAEKLVDVVFTASQESFRIKSKKLNITGHGIDTARFAPQNAPKDIDLLTVGRITPSKNIELLIDTLALLREQGHEISLSVVGAPTTDSERTYREKLDAYVSEKGVTDHVHFLGSVPNSELPGYLAKSRVFVHAATNGSLDKALLEPLAMGIPLVTTAEGAASLPLGGWHVPEDADTFAEAVKTVLESDTAEESKRLREFVKENHSIESLIPKILQYLSKR